ncbi:MAG: hypothetical protein JWM11_6820 [Planctomycetaceae bacterium]|nr:hypothetical protein [Planctomycetaceae bacterium]
MLPTWSHGSRRARIVALSIVLMISFSQTGFAVAPEFVSDRELAESPVIVVAKWNGAPWKKNSLIVEDQMKGYEFTTEIEVQRVIKGDIALGKHSNLVRITNHCFPFDVETSRKAWATASKIRDLKERQAFLSRFAPADSKPWSAKLVTEMNEVFIEVTNQSPSTMTLARLPKVIDVRTRNGIFGVGTKSELKHDKSDFITLETGKSCRFQLNTQGNKTFKDGYATSSLSIDLAYLSNGNKFGVNAWIGVISFMTPGR